MLVAGECIIGISCIVGWFLLFLCLEWLLFSLSLRLVLWLVTSILLQSQWMHFECGAYCTTPSVLQNELVDISELNILSAFVFEILPDDYFRKSKHIVI
jgi:hypothetical protein